MKYIQALTGTDLLAVTLFIFFLAGVAFGFFVASLFASRRFRRIALDTWKQADIFYRRRSIEDHKQLMEKAIHELNNNR